MVPVGDAASLSPPSLCSLSLCRLSALFSPCSEQTCSRVLCASGLRTWYEEERVERVERLSPAAQRERRRSAVRNSESLLEFPTISMSSGATKRIEQYVGGIPYYPPNVLRTCARFSSLNH